MIKAIFLVGMGGFLGSAARYLVDGWVTRMFPGHFPLGTLVVNIAGSFVIGVLIGLATRLHTFDHTQRLIWITGFCGGFTTFSTFSFDSLTLITHQRFLYLAVYLGTSITVGLIAAYGGYELSRG